MSLNDDWVSLRIPLRRDPALDKLLKDLPAGDPDAEPPEQIEVWIPWCQGRHLVPRGDTVTIRFGAWCGPPMSAHEIPILARLLTDSEPTQFYGSCFSKDPNALIEAGDTLKIANWKIPL